VTTLSGIGVSDTLPTGVTVANPSGAKTTCANATLTATAGGGGFSLKDGELAPGASCTASLAVTATKPGVKTNTSGSVGSVQSGSGGSTTASLTVSLPSNQFRIRGVKANRNGNVSFIVAVPGPGTLDLLETAPDRDFATTATAGPQNPGRGRFAFARVHLILRRGGTTRITVKPTVKARSLLQGRNGQNLRPVTISLFVTYTPTNGLPHTEVVPNVFVVKCFRITTPTTACF
jgi:hypothetical protein